MATLKLQPLRSGFDLRLCLCLNPFGWRWLVGFRLSWLHMLLTNRCIGPFEVCVPLLARQKAVAVFSSRDFHTPAAFKPAVFSTPASLQPAVFQPYMFKPVVFSTPEAFNPQFFEPTVQKLFQVFSTAMFQPAIFSTSEAAVILAIFFNTMFNPAVFSTPVAVSRFIMFFRCHLKNCSFFPLHVFLMFFTVAVWKHQDNSFTIYISKHCLK